MTKHLVGWKTCVVDIDSNHNRWWQKYTVIRPDNHKHDTRHIVSLSLSLSLYIYMYIYMPCLTSTFLVGRGVFVGMDWIMYIKSREKEQTSRSRHETKRTNDETNTSWKIYRERISLSLFNLSSNEWHPSKPRVIVSVSVRDRQFTFYVPFQ